MRKRNHTVTIRMNEKEYALLQQKIKASGQTQQAVILAAIENVDLMSAEVKEELNVLNQRLGETNRLLSHPSGDHRLGQRGGQKRGGGPPGQLL